MGRASMPVGHRAEHPSLKIGTHHSLSAVVSHRTKVSAKELSTDSSAQSATIFEGMMIVEASVNARPEHLVKQVTRVLERVRVNAIAEREAVYDNVNLAGFEAVSDQAGDRSRDATVRSGIFGMAWSAAQR
jgi:hypothetical protein